MQWMYFAEKDIFNVSILISSTLYIKLYNPHKQKHFGIWIN